MVQALADERNARILDLLRRRTEIKAIMAAELMEHIQWRTEVRAKFEECEEIKANILKCMTSKQKLRIAKEEFIRILRNVNFDHEVEDVYGAGKHMYRSFRDVECEVCDSKALASNDVSSFSKYC